MPRTEVFDCPSGLKIMIRSRITRDYNVLASEDPQAARVYYENVITQTMERGPYQDEQFYDDGRPRLAGCFLTGDWHAIRLKHHQLNVPDKPFIKRFVCDGDKCGYSERIKLWLGDEHSDGKRCEDGIYRLRMKKLSQEAADQFTNKNQFNTHLDLADRNVTFKLNDRRCMDKFREFVRRQGDTTDDERATAITCTRIVRVEGVGESFRAILDWYSSLDDDESDELIEKMDAMDCGPDWDIFPLCPREDKYKTMMVDIDENFFARERQKRRAVSRA